MNIINKIHKLRLDFMREEVRSPNILLIGDKEWIDLRREGEASILMDIIRMDSIFGMKIIEVAKDNFLEVAYWIKKDN